VARDEVLAGNSINPGLDLFLFFFQLYESYKLRRVW